MDTVYEILRSEEVSSEEAATFSVKSKAWLQLYLTVYETKHVTPYMHALVAHLHEFFANPWRYCTFYTTKARKA